MPAELPDLFSVLCALDPEELAIVAGGRSEGLMGAVRVGLVGVSLLTGDTNIKAPLLPERPAPIVQTLPFTQK